MVLGTNMKEEEEIKGLYVKIGYSAQRYTEPLYGDGLNVESMENIQYSLAQKHCSKFSNENFLVFFTVNLLENLHASTYDI